MRCYRHDQLLPTRAAGATDICHCGKEGKITIMTAGGNADCKLRIAEEMQKNETCLQKTGQSVPAHDLAAPAASPKQCLNTLLTAPAK